MPFPIIICKYNVQWPALYESEKARIIGAVGNKFITIEHIGSTAVPGLDAKPIIDMMAAVQRMSDSLDCIEPLKELGYDYFFYPEFPERCVFSDGSIGGALHHLHVTEFKSDFWKEKLLFRDYLRTHKETAAQYSQLKKSMAIEYGSDREKYEAYTEAKAPFIETILTKARSDQKLKDTK